MCGAEINFDQVIGGVIIVACVLMLIVAFVGLKRSMVRLDQ